MPLASQRREPTPDAVEFIRFCYQRRRVGWPELYDEMCAVAAKGLFRGWSHEELASHGVTFGLAGLPALAAIARRLVEEEPLPRPAVRVRAAAHAQAGAVAEAGDPVPVAAVPPPAPELLEPAQVGDEGVAGPEAELGAPELAPI